MAANLQIESVAGTRAGLRVLRMTGRLGLETVPQFLKVVRAENDPVLILDFGGVSFIDSAGVGSLIQTMAALKKDHRQMALTAVNERVRAVLEVTRVHSLLPSYPTITEAEQQLS